MEISDFLTRSNHIQSGLRIKSKYISTFSYGTTLKPENVMDVTVAILW